MSSHDDFEALCDAAFDGDEDGLMLFWKACFDASGKHSDLLVVAGFLSNRHGWKEFNKRWRVPLTTGSRIDVFHATDFEAGQRDFTPANGWSDSRRDQARVELIDALLGANLQLAVACAVRINDYEQGIPRWMREQPGLGTAYEFALHACMGEASRWCQYNNIPDPIQYVVEHGEGREGTIQEAFNRAFALPRSRQFFRLGRLIFDTKDGAMGLQAADMLANYVWSEAIGNRPAIEPYSRITHASNLRYEYFDAKRLKEQIEADKRGRQIITPELTLNRKTPEPIDIEVSADFSEADEYLTKLETLADTFPQEVYSLVKHSPSFEKLFSVQAENSSAPPTNDLRIAFKPNDLALTAVAAIGASQSDCELSERKVSHESSEER
jgi:hypothetical protein